MLKRKDASTRLVDVSIRSKFASCSGGGCLTEGWPIGFGLAPNIKLRMSASTEQDGHLFEDDYCMFLPSV